MPWQNTYGNTFITPPLGVYNISQLPVVTIYIIQNGNIVVHHKNWNTFLISNFSCIVRKSFLHLYIFFLELSLQVRSMATAITLLVWLSSFNYHVDGTPNSTSSFCSEGFFLALRKHQYNVCRPASRAHPVHTQSGVDAISLIKAVFTLAGETNICWTRPGEACVSERPNMSRNMEWEKLWWRFGGLLPGIPKKYHIVEIKFKSMHMQKP